MNTYCQIALATLLMTLLQLPPAQAQNSSQAQGEAVSGKSGAAPQQHRRGAQKFVLENSEGASIRLWKPDLSTVPLVAEHGSITLPNTGMDNYHAVVVERDWGALKEALIRYQYMHGKPSGHSTRELTAAEKTSFEIVPDPVPREHQHYHSARNWNFLLRFHGAPAANVAVVLESSNGTSLSSISDAEGKVSLLIPDDFSHREARGQDQRSAEFTVSAELADDSVTYQTQLSAEYRVDPSRWRSLGLGVFVTAIGLAVGGLLGHKAVRSS